MARLYIKTPWSYETDSWVDVTSVDFNSKKIHEDENFRLTKYITIFLRSIQTLQMCKIPKHEIGTLNHNHHLLTLWQISVRSAPLNPRVTLAI